MDDSQQEDCTVYIEELKSDNPSLKLNAATKIGVIGSVLGHGRIKDELIPYIIEIIEQMDNDNEFLINVCKGILELKQYCKTPLELSTLIYPLRVLASLDQPPVRDEAVKRLKELPHGQNKDFYEKYFYPLILTLTAQNTPYSPKVAACSLIPITYPHISQPQQAELRNIFKALALKSGNPLIRRAVAENIQAFAGVIEKEAIRTEMFAIWQALIVDTFDIIRIKAMETAVIVARTFKKEENAEKFLKPIKLVDSNKKSWRVRYSLVECLAAIIPYLEKDVVKKDIVEMFQELLKDQEAQVRAISLIKLSELTSKISPQQAWTVFFQYIEKASKDANKEAAPTVKLAVVEAVIPFFKTVEKERIVEAGLPIITSLLKDENHNIRIGIMQRLMELGEIVGKEGIVKYIIPLIEGCVLDKKWRFKLSIAQNIPNFFKVLPYEQHKDFLDKIINVFMKDHNFTVREQTLKSIVASKSHVQEKYFQIIQKYFQQLFNEPNYIYRVTAAAFLQNIKNIDKAQLSELLSQITKKMQNQKIANVLVAYLITYGKIKDSVSAAVRKEVQALIAKIKEEKQDEDVLYYASRLDQ